MSIDVDPQKLQQVVSVRGFQSSSAQLGLVLSTADGGELQLLFSMDAENRLLRQLRSYALLRTERQPLSPAAR